MCQHCNEPVTVYHVLLECRLYASMRTRHLGSQSSSITMKHLLGDDSRWIQDGSLFSFIRDTNFPVVFSSR